MPEKEKKPEFVVTDRRLFSSDGELRQDVVEDEERRAEREREKREAQQRHNEERAAQRQPTAPPASAPAANASAVELPATPDADEPDVAPPSAQEQKASAAAYEQSAREIDAQLEQEMRKHGRPHSAKDFQVSFDKFIASLYMTALMQLGLAAPQGEKPGVDLIGARQTVDTVAMLHEKTKGNLTPAEDNMLQNILYELRMAYLEVTKLITNPPPAGAGAERR